MNLQFSSIVFFLIALVVIVLMGGYINTMLEKSRELKIRRQRDFSEKLDRIRRLSIEFPGQFMTADLKALLFRIEYGCGQRLIALGIKTPAITKRQEELKAGIVNPRGYLDENKPLPVVGESVARSIRAQISALHAVLTCALQDDLISNSEAQRWVQHLRAVLVRMYVEMFTRLAADEMAAQTPRKAKLTIERAIQFVSKHNTSGQYSADIEQFKSSLELATKEALRLEKDILPSDENVLGASVAMLLDEEESWKKRVF